MTYSGLVDYKKLQLVDSSTDNLVDLQCWRETKELFAIAALINPIPQHEIFEVVRAFNEKASNQTNFLYPENTLGEGR